MGEKVRQLILWPDRVFLRYEIERGERTEPERPFISYTCTEDGPSLLTEIRVLRAIFQRGEEGVEIQTGGELRWDTDSESELDSDIEVEVELEIELGGGLPITPPPEAQLGHEKTVSVPCTPDNADPVGIATSPFQWSRRTLRSMSMRHKEIQSVEEGKGEAWATEERSGGRKRCLQLDLRGVGEYDIQGEGAYHLGKSPRIFGRELRLISLLISRSSCFPSSDFVFDRHR